MIGLIGAFVCGIPAALQYDFLWIFSRIICAFFYGLAQIATIRYLEEYMPLDLYGTGYSITSLF